MTLLGHWLIFQGLLKAEASAVLFKIVEYFSDQMRPIRLRFGIGFGALSTPLREVSVGMDGPAWHRAKEAVENAGDLVSFRGFGEQNDEILGSLASLLLVLVRRWSRRQRDFVSMTREGLTQVQIATQARLTQSAVSQRLLSAEWRTYNRGVTALSGLIADCTADSGQSVEK